MRYAAEYTRQLSQSMTICLTKAQIDAALPAVARGLKKYLWLQENRDKSDLRSNPLYKRQFNHFYKVRRGKEWQDHFYSLLEAKKGKRVCFSEVLDALYQATNRYEASFASKLLATVEPSMPVIDSIVFRNLNLRLPTTNSKDRAARICQLHTMLLAYFNEFLSMENGKYLVQRFRETYPDADITEVKMLDLVLWQTRPNRSVNPTAH